MTRLLAALLCLGLLAGCSDATDPDAADPAAPEASASATATQSARPLTPDEQRWRRAQRIVARMTLAQKAGQVLVPAWTGGEPPLSQVRRLHLGGVIALPGAAMSPGTARAGNQALHRLFQRRGAPAFIGIDQEGGIVSRLASPATTFPAFMAAGAADRPELTRKVERALGGELRGLGFSVVFSPSADVTVGGSDPAIGSRSAGSSPGLVARHVVQAVAGLREAGVLPVVKHFPGHGSVTTDSHRATPVQTRSLKRLERVDLMPFARAIAHDAPAVMTGHIVLPRVDRRPATASRKVTMGLLRGRLGFDGLVVTDALNMRGITDRFPGARASLMALEAGADVLLMPPDPRAARDLIVRSVLTGRISISRLDEAAVRMVHALLAVPRARGLAVGSGREAAAELTRAAVTSVAGTCGTDELPEVVRVTGTPGAVDRFTAAAKSQGVRIQTTIPKRKRVRTVVFRFERVRVPPEKPGGKATYERKRVRKVVRVLGPPPPPPAPLVALLGYGASVPDEAAIAIALDRPTTLGLVDAPVELAVYSNTSVAMQTAVAVLAGTAGAPGRLTTPVYGAAHSGC